MAAFPVLDALMYLRHEGMESFHIPGRGNVAVRMTLPALDRLRQRRVPSP